MVLATESKPKLNNEVNALYKQLQDKFSRLETTQEEISDLLLISDELKNTYQEDFLKAEEYRDKFGQICSLLEARQEKTILVPEENISVDKRKFKLPKLELRKFSGEPKDFLPFWSQFEKIHQDTTIAEEDKFQYLLRCVVPDSKAARLVPSFQPTKDNYSKAITELKERFGRDELLVQIYVRDVLSIVMKNAAGRNKVDLSELYDLLESKLMALESLGRTKEKFAEFLEPLVQSCLPETVFHAWERSLSLEDSSSQDRTRSLDKLLCFLRNEVQSEEMIMLARIGLGASRLSHPRSQPDEPDFSTAATLVNFQDSSDRESAKSNDENTVVSSSVLSNQYVINETVYLKTLVLKIEHNGKELKVRTMLDSGSQKSYIGKGH
ncbi:putative RNA-directed DNA polymerase from transposon X-element [Trichonephila clavipes]|nr:putative RNA-directed DNA polymerase from transposon X-element [Trichonephila clavipes]